MKKSLLLGLMAVGASVSGYAFEQGEYVYAPQGRFQITNAANLCTNGNCASNFDGWTAISAAAENTAADLFAYNSDTQSFSSKTNAVGEGMYYKFNLPNPSGSYVVSVKLRQQALAYPYSTNVYYTTDATTNTNTYGTTGTAAAGLNFLSVFGNVGGFASNEEFLSYGKAVFLKADWETATYAIVGDGTVRDYYIAMSQMDPTVEIADIQIQEAVQVADLRQRDAAVAYAQAIVNAKEWEDTDEYAILLENIEVCQTEITDDMSQEDMLGYIEGLNAAITAEDGTGFLDVRADNYLASSCAASTIWSQNTTKYQKMTSIGDWELSNARWFHCNNNDAEQRELLKPYIDAPNFGYSNGMIGAQYCKMVKTLLPGTYIFSMGGQAYTMHRSNVVAAGTASNYLHNEGVPTGQMELYIKPAAEDAEPIVSNTIALPVTEFATNIVAVHITEAGDYEIGVNLSQVAPEGYTFEGVCKGGTYTLTEPRLFCSLDGKWNAAELKYVDDVKAQITALESNLATAQEYLENAEYPWLNTEIADTIAKYKEYLAFYQTLSDDDIYKGFVDPVSQVENNGYANYIDGEDPETGASIPTYNAIDTIMNNTVRKVIRFCEAYSAANAVFPALKAAIANAQTTLTDPVYSTATGMDDLVAAIATAQSVYNDKAANGSYDLTEGAENADFTAVQEAATAVAEAAALFKTTLPAESITSIVDIDFSNPAVLNDATGLYSVAGTKGSMEFSYFAENTPTAANDLPFELGFDENGEKKSTDVLRVGNGTGTVVVDQSEYGNDLIRVSFDFYFMRLSDRYTGFYLKDAEEQNVAGLYFTPYNLGVTPQYDSFGFDLSKFVGTTSDNLGSLTESNKTSFELIIDYINKKMWATSVSASGTQTTPAVEFDGRQFTSFVVTSNYANFNGRRSWFDNLKIEKVTYDPTGVQGVTEVAPAANDGAIYNVAGQKVSTLVKGQIYIKNGAAFVK